MLRIFLYLVGVLAAAAVAIWLIGIEGVTEVDFAGTKIVGRTSAFLGLIIVAGLLLIFGTTIVSWLAALPARLRQGRRARRQTRGMTALTRGLEAVAAGDAEDAQHHARLANKNLEQPALTRLLTAQAAQIAGDDATARESYAAMLDAPETEFLGLRGLYLQAIARGDKAQAKAYADRAFRLRPNAPWAFESVYALSLDRGAWGDARDALLLARRQGTQENDESKRKEAALLTAQAYASRDAGDDDAARHDAEEALKKAPGLAPAAVLAAELEAASGRRGKAGRILDAAWRVSPHPAMAKTMAEIFAGVSPERRIARLRKLARQNEGHEESRILIAEQHVAAGEHQEAMTTLEPLLRAAPTARVFVLMADAAEGLHGKEAAEPWLERAASAPRDPVPGADGTFHFTTEGWQRLVREYGDHGRLAPPPLEVVETALPEDEILRLMAPPQEAPVDAADAEDEGMADSPAHQRDEQDAVIVDEEASEAPEAIDVTVSEPLEEPSKDEAENEKERA